MIWRTQRTEIDLTHHARVMGILNLTPDSFSDGGRHSGIDRALVHARRMISEGAAIIDVGGESTRPGSAEVPCSEEISRTEPVIRALRREWGGLISIDTTKAEVAATALAAGADIVNDITGLTGDPAMPGVCAGTGCGVVVMHMQGVPRTMQMAPRYDDVVSEVRGFFEVRFGTLVAAGIDPLAICFDPGIGFGKNLGHNLSLIRHLDQLTISNRPILLGISRKSFIGKVLDAPDLEFREWPTVALGCYAREKGVMLHRVHAVRPNVEALRMTEAILGPTA